MFLRSFHLVDRLTKDLPSFHCHTDMPFSLNEPMKGYLRRWRHKIRSLYRVPRSTCVLRSNHNFQWPQEIKRFREPRSTLSLRPSTSHGSLIAFCWHTTPQHCTDSATSSPSNHTSELGLDTTFAKDDDVQTLKNDYIVSYNEVREHVVNPLVFIGDLQNGGASLDLSLIHI